MMNTKEIEAKNVEMFVINIDDFGTEISVTSNGDEVGTIGLERKLGELNRPDYYHIIHLGLDGCSGIGIGRQCLIFHRQCFEAVITAGLSGTDEAKDASHLTGSGPGLVQKMRSDGLLAEESGTRWDRRNTCDD